MYNEELKKSFIRGYTQSLHTAEVARVIFDAIAPYENEWGTDFCTRSAAELQPVLDNILGLRSSSKWMTIIILREYVKWCMLKKYPGACDSIMHADTVGLDKIRAQMVASPLHLQKYFNEVFDMESEETIDNTYRCYLWMAYGGISEEGALAVKIEDVNLETLRVTGDGIDTPIYREALQAFKNAISLPSFLYKHPNYRKPVRRDRILGNTIMRGIKSNIQVLTIRSTLSKRLTDAAKSGRTKIKLSFYRIWLSGLFYRTYEMERAGFLVDFSEAAVMEMEGKTYALGGRETLRMKQNRKARDYMEDYQRWKLAFSI
jgi:hypothetical protein